MYMLFKEKINQHFNKNISATVFTKPSYQSSKSKRPLPLPRNKTLFTIESKTLK